jgi:DNA polymerase V
VLHFVRCDAAAIRKQFGVVLEKTLLDLRGTSCQDMADVEDAPTAKQQILVSRSFGKAITHPAGIVEEVSEFASRAAEKLRHQQSAAGAVGIFFMTSPFRQHDRQHSVNVTVPLIRPTADTGLLVAAAVAVVGREFRAGFNYARRESCCPICSRHLSIKESSNCSLTPQPTRPCRGTVPR